MPSAKRFLIYSLIISLLHISDSLYKQLKSKNHRINKNTLMSYIPLCLKAKLSKWCTYCNCNYVIRVHRTYSYTCLVVILYVQARDPLFCVFFDRASWYDPCK